MPISFKHKAIFIHIPKTGGQSISKMLKIRKGSRKHFYRYSNEDEPTHYTIYQIKDRINIDDFYKFTFVRDPYTRIISEYNHRIRSLGALGHEPTDYFMSFEKYCEELYRRWDEIKSVDHFYKSHVIPQIDFVDASVEIYRYENFADECEQLKVNLGIDTPTPFVNRGNYTTQHTDRTRDIIGELYEEDFKTFGYDI